MANTSTNTPTQRATPQPHSTTPLPAGLSPNSIDTLPALTAILSRLQPPNASSAPGTATTSHGHNTTHQAGPSPLGGTGTPALASAGGAGGATLTLKDIGPETDGLKHRLQIARQMVKEMPDMERGVEEQEEEIRELEAKIREQKGVLEGLKSVAEGLRKGMK